MTSDVSDLSQLNNQGLQQNIVSLGDQIQSVDALLSMLNCPEGEATYDSLDAADKAQIDLFKTYASNALFWVYLKTKGKDAANHAVKNELGRVKEHLNRAKLLKDRALAPKLNQGVAKRFVRSGLWEPKEKTDVETNFVQTNSLKTWK
jgi:exosome complex protein LRP1